MVSEPHVTPESFRPQRNESDSGMVPEGKKRARVLRCAGLDRKGKEGDILRTYIQLDF